MGKKFSIDFNDTDEDQRLLKETVNALEGTRKGDFEFTVVHDDTAKVTTVMWWRKPLGGFDAN